jgi:hypothetical protein
MTGFEDITREILNANPASNAMHKPTEFDPTQYVAVDWFDNQGGGYQQGFGAEELNHVLECRKLLRESPTSVYNKGDRGSQCDHCGAHIRYVGVVKHLPTGTYMAMGENCLERLNIEDKAAFRLKFIRDQAHNEAVHQKRLAAQTAFFGSHPGLEEALKTDHHISKDLGSKLYQWGSLSERQVALAFKLQKDVAEQATRMAERAQQDAQLDDAPEGKLRVVGTILTIKTVESAYGVTTKCLLLVESPAKFKLWVTLPTSLSGTERGQKVAMNVTVERSKDDSKFAYGSRPTKGEVIA